MPFLHLLIYVISIPVYTVLLHLKESMNQGEFFMAIRNMPVAYALFIQVCTCTCIVCIHRKVRSLYFR